MACENEYLSKDPPTWHAPISSTVIRVQRLKKSKVNWDPRINTRKHLHVGGEGRNRNNKHHEENKIRRPTTSLQTSTINFRTMTKVERMTRQGTEIKSNNYSVGTRLTEFAFSQHNTSSQWHRGLIGWKFRWWPNRSGIRQIRSISFDYRNVLKSHNGTFWTPQLFDPFSHTYNGCIGSRIVRVGTRLFHPLWTKSGHWRRKDGKGKTFIRLLLIVREGEEIISNQTVQIP